MIGGEAKRATRPRKLVLARASKLKKFTEIYPPWVAMFLIGNSRSWNPVIIGCDTFLVCAEKGDSLGDFAIAGINQKLNFAFLS